MRIWTLGTFIELIALGLLANGCFLAAPIVESYFSWLGIWRRWMTWCLFLLGTAFTMCLAVEYCLSVT